MHLICDNQGEVAMTLLSQTWGIDRHFLCSLREVRRLWTSFISKMHIALYAPETIRNVWSIIEQFLMVIVYSLFKTIIDGPLHPQHSLNFIYSPTFKFWVW